MAWAPCSWTTAFRRCAGLGAARLTSPAAQHPRPSTTSTSRATTAGTDRALGRAPVSTWRRTTTPSSACNARPRGALVAAAVEVAVVGTTSEYDVDDCDGGSAPVVHVYGSVTAKIRPASDDRWAKEHRLFRRAKGQLVRVPTDAPMPLQTTALVSAPLCSASELQVSAELLDASASWQNPDREIACGSVVFAPRLAGTDTAEIDGADGKVRVDVTWSTY